MTNSYDVIVIGARCAGSPTAMLLARKGYRVLLVDRAKFPSDTLSTHLIHPPGVAALDRWGLLERLIATHCPPVHTYAIDFGPFTITGAPGTLDHPVAYAPRRTVLDKLLLDAAATAGAEIREGFGVAELVAGDGRTTGIRGHAQGGSMITEHSRIVIGADGFRSLVARATKAPEYHTRPRLLCGYYSYWSGLPMNGRFEDYERPGRAFAAWPTHDDLTLVIGGWPYTERDAHKSTVEDTLLSMFEMAPAFANRVSGATRVERIVGTAVPNFFRKPYGPGWALVGDAGYNKDFITAQGIQDAYRDAELCATAVDQALSGARSHADAMADYQHARDRHVMPMYELTTQIAGLEPAPPEMEHLLAAVAGNDESMNGFTRMMAGTTSPADFFAEENVERILAAAADPRMREGADPGATSSKSR